MGQAFDAHGRKIGELLEGVNTPRLVIPAFQRGYSWERKQVEMFWNDLKNFESEKVAKTADAYFFGPIVTQEDRDQGVVIILDGQQRLATATILFSVIRDCAYEIGSDGESFGSAIQQWFIEKNDAGDFQAYTLTMGELDRDYFKQTIQERRNGQSPKVAAVLKSHEAISAARKLLYNGVKSKLSGKSEKDQLGYLKTLRTLLRELVMTVIPVTSEKEAFHIFETLNDRGLRLSTPDLLLNHLMRHASTTSRDEIRSNWNTMLEHMGRRRISDFLRHVWIARYGDLKAMDLFSALKKKIETDADSVVEFSRVLSEDCAHYVQLLDSSPQLGKGQAAIQSLLAIDCKAALPLLLVVYKSLPEEAFAKISRLILVFFVRFAVIAGRDMGELEATLFKLSQEASDLVAKLADHEHEAAIFSHIKRTLEQNSFSDDVLRALIADLKVSSDQATYMVPTLAKYFEDPVKEIASLKVTVEHIFPKKPKADDWPDHAKFNGLLWHIGNLTVLGANINNRAANKAFPAKVEVSYKKSSLTINQKIVEEFKEWTPESVRKRAESLASVVLSIWSFDNPSRV